MLKTLKGRSDLCAASAAAARSSPGAACPRDPASPHAVSQPSHTGQPAYAPPTHAQPGPARCTQPHACIRRMLMYGVGGCGAVWCGFQTWG